MDSDRPPPLSKNSFIKSLSPIRPLFINVRMLISITSFVLVSTLSIVSLHDGHSPFTFLGLFRNDTYDARLLWYCYLIVDLDKMY